MLAQDEYNHLNNALATLATSRTSLYSSASGVSTKYDPDLLKSDVALAKNRVSRLKSELEQIKNEMRYTQKGVDTLTKYVLIQLNYFSIYILLFFFLLVLNRNYTHIKATISWKLKL